MSLDIILWISFAILIAVCWFHHKDGVKALSAIACIIIGFVLFIGTMEQYLLFPAFEQDYIATQQTLEDSRKSGDEYMDHYSFRNKIVEINQELQRYKYFNDTPLGAFIPDRVEDMERIK